METEGIKIPEISRESKEARNKQEKDPKKGEKMMDQFIKSIANCTPKEMIDALCKKNREALDQVRTLTSTVESLQEKINILEKQKEVLHKDQSGGVQEKSRLETICCELQQLNKSIQDESMQKIREDEEKRKEVFTRFQAALNEVSVMMQQNEDKNLKLRDDNIEISNKFHILCDQFKQRQEEVIRLTKQVDLEKELAEATVKRIECQLKAEQGIWAKEKKHYAAHLKFHEKEKIKYEDNIKTMEDHLSLYSKKFNDFETTIKRSNMVFDSYKLELNSMRKKLQILQHENNIWKEKWVESQHTLTDFAVEHSTCQQSIVDHDRKLKQLADLCRSIQEERSAYLKQLKENGLTPVVVVVEKPAVLKLEKSKNIAHKMTKKEKKLSFKKEMQADLSVINQQENPITPQNSFEKVKKVEEETSDPLINANQQEIDNIPDLHQKQAEDSDNLNQIVVTENNESCEISTITEEKSSVSDSVNIDNSKTDLAAPKNDTKKENEQNVNLVCVNVKEQLNLSAQGSLNHQLKVKTE